MQMLKIDCCCTIENEFEGESSAIQLLKLMDRVGVNFSVIHMSKRCFAWENEIGNDLTTSIARKYPQRFISVITVNPWRPDAWEILKRYLDRDIYKIIAFSPADQGFLLSGHNLDFLLEKMCQYNLKVPIYIHTGHHSNSTPCQLAMLACRYPQIDFIMGHAGSTDFKADVLPVCMIYKNIFPEASFARQPGFIHDAIAYGKDRAIMGSGFPYNNFEYEWENIKKYLSVADAESILGHNFAKLLKLTND